MYENLAILAIFAFVYSAVGGALEKTPFSGALVFTACGLAFGPLGLDLLQLNMDADGIRTLAEITLALVLFSDAANANLGVLKRRIRLPGRLLAIGLPLTILLGFGIGVLLVETLSLLALALIDRPTSPRELGELLDVTATQETVWRYRVRSVRTGGAGALPGLPRY